MQNRGIASHAAFLSDPGRGCRAGGGTTDHHRRAIRPRISWCWAYWIRRAGLAGIAPWYLKRTAAKGWVLRWLGSGEVCSDYASILSMPEDADRVTEALAAYLTGSNCAAGARHCWDLLEVDGVDSEDSSVTRLLRQLDERGCVQHDNAPARTWRLVLPKTWEEFLARFPRATARSSAGPIATCLQPAGP